MSDLPASAQRVLDAAQAAGINARIAAFPDGTRTAEDAARAVGCAVDQIVKSMIFDADGEVVLALTSGSHQVDGAKLAELAGVTACKRAKPEQVRAVTSFAIGGVAPFGHNEPVRSWFDPHLLTFDEVWAAAGTPSHVFAAAPTALLEATGAILADFTQT